MRDATNRLRQKTVVGRYFAVAKRLKIPATRDYGRLEKSWSLTPDCVCGLTGNLEPKSGNVRLEYGKSSVRMGLFDSGYHEAEFQDLAKYLPAQIIPIDQFIP